ncbi:MAG TPA: hypothetical protein VF624_10420 [Tepidisphaeraceae bacterium]
MSRFLSLLLVWSIALLGTGVGQVAHELAAHRGQTAGGQADVHATADHDADHAGPAMQGHRDHDSDDAPPDGHSHRGKHSCTVCQALALLGKAQQAPPVSAVLPASAPLRWSPSSSLAVDCSASRLSPTAAPRGPPVG